MPSIPSKDFSKISEISKSVDQGQESQSIKETVQKVDIERKGVFPGKKTSTMAKSVYASDIETPESHAALRKAEFNFVKFVKKVLEEHRGPKRSS